MYTSRTIEFEIEKNIGCGKGQKFFLIGNKSGVLLELWITWHCRDFAKVIGRRAAVAAGAGSCRLLQTQTSVCCSLIVCCVWCTRTKGQCSWTFLALLKVDGNDFFIESYCIDQKTYLHSAVFIVLHTTLPYFFQHTGSGLPLNPLSIHCQLLFLLARRPYDVVYFPNHLSRLRTKSQ